MATSKKQASSFSAPAQVYLFGSAQLAAQKGGATGHAYSSFQAAFNAAVVLSAAVNPVVIVADKVTAAQVGNVTLTADWPALISIVGISRTESVLGNIIGDSAIASAFNGDLTMNNVSITNLSAKTTGAGPFDGPSWNLSGSNFGITLVDLSLTNAANSGGTGQFIYQSNDSGSVISTITCNTANATSFMNGVYVTPRNVTIGDINHVGGGDGIGTVNLGNARITGTVTVTQSASATVACNLVWDNCQFTNLVWNQCGGGGNNFMTGCRGANFTYTNLGAASTTLFIWNSYFTNGGSSSFQCTSTAANYLTIRAGNSYFDTIKNLSAGAKLTNCTIFNNIQAIGASCILRDCSTEGGVSGTIAGITSVGAVTVTVKNTSFAGPPSPTTVTLIEEAPARRNLGATNKTVTATLTAAEVISGYITSPTAAAVSLTLATATLIAQALNAGAGQEFPIIFHNTGGTNTLTVVVNTGITVPGTVVITGSNVLTVAPGEIGRFVLSFTSATTAKLFRVS